MNSKLYFFYLFTYSLNHSFIHSTKLCVSLTIFQALYYMLNFRDHMVDEQFKQESLPCGP